MVERISDLITALAALAAVLVARAGLTTWQQQLRGTAEYDLARRVLRAVLKVRDQVTNVRNPFILGQETEAAFAEAGVEGEADHGRETQMVYDRRWKLLQQARSELSIELLEAEVLWGAEVRQHEDKLNTCINELWSAVLRHVRENLGRAVKETPEQYERREAVLYQMSSDPTEDEYGGRLLAAVQSFETYLAPHLRSRVFVDGRF